MQLTEHFRVEEFAGNDAAQTPVPPEYMDNVRLLAQQLEVVRQKIGTDIIISSGYRTPEHNASPDVGGVSNSRHLTAKGADLYADMPLADLYCVFDRLMKLGPSNGGIINGGLGIYASHIHYDTRGAASRWTGTGIAVPDCPPPQEEDEGMSSQEHQEAMQANANTNALLGEVGALALGNNAFIGAIGQLLNLRGAQVEFLIAAMQSVHPPADAGKIADLVALKDGLLALKSRVAEGEAEAGEVREALVEVGKVLAAKESEATSH